MNSALGYLFGFPATLIHPRYTGSGSLVVVKPAFGGCSRAFAVTAVGCGSGAFTIGAARKGYRSGGRQQSYDGPLQRLKEAGVSASLKASNIRVVDSTVPRVSPVKPIVRFNLAIGLFMGLVCGVSLAFIQEYMDSTLKTPDDIENFLRRPALAEE